MAQKSNIEWTDSTWNPVTGCTKSSPGCRNCYAERMARRLRAMGQARYRNGFALTLQKDLVNVPLGWKKPRIVFVNSMSDLFHEQVPTEYILAVFRVMQEAKWHQFQILTKRSKRLTKLDPLLPWGPNVWMGVSVEDANYKFRIDHLRRTGARVKFVSFEPLLGPVQELNLENIDWVIVGGESGPNARAMKEAWVLDICQKCQECDVAFFFKQWGGRNRRKNGRTLKGREWSEVPTASCQSELSFNT